MEHATEQAAEHPSEHAQTITDTAPPAAPARVTLSEAARLTGASRNRLYRAIEAGRISRSDDGLIATQELLAAGFELKEGFPGAVKPTDHVSFLLAQNADITSQLWESLEDQTHELRRHIHMLEVQSRILQEQLRLSQQREAKLMQLLQACPAAAGQAGRPCPEPQDAPPETHRIALAEEPAEPALATPPAAAAERPGQAEPEPRDASSGRLFARWKS